MTKLTSSKDVLVLLSGGLDSMSLAFLALAQGRLGGVLCIDYGQPAHVQETEAVGWFGATYKIQGKVAVVPIHGMVAMLGERGARGPRIVPGRNLIFLSIAANYAANLGLSEVWLGATADDHDSYADCRIDWIERASELTQAACGVRVEAPFVKRTKAEIVEVAKFLRVPIGKTFSCYTPLEPVFRAREGDSKRGAPCGTCNACREREAAIASAAGEGE